MFASAPSGIAWLYKVSAEDRQKALASIEARIPKPTPAEERAVLLEAASAIITSNEQTSALFASMIEGDEAIVRQCEQMAAGSTVTSRSSRIPVPVSM